MFFGLCSVILPRKKLETIKFYERWLNILSSSTCYRSELSFLYQVGHLGEEYQEWVHQPIVSKEGPRFFESDFWEVWQSLLVFKRIWFPPNVWEVIEITCRWLTKYFLFECKIVLDSHGLVGDSFHLAAGCLLVHINVLQDGSYSFRVIFDGGIWSFCVDVTRIYSSSISFPYQNQELLVSNLNTA